MFVLGSFRIACRVGNVKAYESGSSSVLYSIAADLCRLDSQTRSQVPYAQLFPPFIGFHWLALFVSCASLRRRRPEVQTRRVPFLYFLLYVGLGSRVSRRRLRFVFLWELRRLFLVRRRKRRQSSNWLRQVEPMGELRLVNRPERSFIYQP